MGGCLYHVHEDTDRLRAVVAAQNIDLAPATFTIPERATSPTPERLPPPTEKKAANGLPQITTDRDFEKVSLGSPGTEGTVKQAGYTEADDTPKTSDIDRFKLPAAVPGPDALLPQFPLKQPTPAERQKIIETFFPELPKLPEAPKPLPGPEGKPYSLADLQQLAAQNSPQLAQAASDVKAAEGNLRQSNT